MVALAHQGFEIVVLVDELVRIPVFAVQALHFVVSLAVFLPAFDLASVRLPEILGQLARTAEQQVEIVDHAIVGVILGANADDGALMRRLMSLDTRMIS